MVSLKLIYMMEATTLTSRWRYEAPWKLSVSWCLYIVLFTKGETKPLVPGKGGQRGEQVEGVQMPCPDLPSAPAGPTGLGWAGSSAT